MAGGKGTYMPWYWILIILAAVIGPFQAARAYEKLQKRRKEKSGTEAPDPNAADARKKR